MLDTRNLPNFYINRNRQRYYQTMKRFFPILITLLVSSLYSGHAQEDAVNVRQGIQGKVLQYLSIGTVLEDGAIIEEVRKRPCQLTVYIFKGEGKIPDNFNINEAIKDVRSNDKGEYSLAMEPGKYLLVVGLDENDKKVIFKRVVMKISISKDVWSKVDIENKETGK
jgi:hypothetical protein